jgi:dihydroflavonol-4-reductase
MDDRYLVTGGTGFVGSYILRLLVAEGKKVRALRRKGSRMGLVEAISDSVEWVECDILDMPYLREAMSGCNKVFHCAAMVSYNAKDAAAMMEVNMGGTANVVNTALDLGVDKLLHLSSIAALGKPKEGAFLDENTKWERSKLNTNYGISKFLAEQEVWRAAAEGLNVAIVNPSIIVGSGYWEEGSCALFSKVWHGLKYYPLGTTGFVDVRDVARAALLLMNSEVSNKRYVLNAANLTYKDLFNNIARHFGKTPPSVKVTPFLRETIWRLGWLGTFLGQEPIATKETARQSSQTFYYGGKKFCEAFKFDYRPLECSIEDTCRSFVASLQSKHHSYATLPL